MFCDKFYKSRIILALIMIKHIILKINKNKIAYNLAYIGLKPKSSQHNQVPSTTWASTFPCHTS